MSNKATAAAGVRLCNYKFYIRKPVITDLHLNDVWTSEQVHLMLDLPAKTLLYTKRRTQCFMEAVTLNKNYK